MERKAFIAELEAYAARVGLRPSTICLRAIGNGHLHRRLTDGGDCSSGTIERVRRYMVENPPTPAPSEDAA